MTKSFMNWIRLSLPLLGWVVFIESDRSLRMPVLNFCRPFRARRLMDFRSRGGARNALTPGYLLSRLQRENLALGNRLDHPVLNLC